MTENKICRRCNYLIINYLKICVTDFFAPVFLHNQFFLHNFET